MKIRIIISGLIVFLFTIVSLHSNVMALNNESENLTDDTETADRPIATVIRFRPDVFIKKPDADEWVQVSVAQQLFNSDSLKTGANGYALVRYMDLSEFRMRPNSLLSLEGEVRGKGNTVGDVSVRAGNILLDVVRGESDHTVRTATSAAAVKGTSFSVNVEEDETVNYTGFSGEVEVTRLGTDEVYDLGRSGRIIIPPDVDIPPIIDVIHDDEFDLLVESFEEVDRLTVPETLRIRVMDDQGNVRTITIPYFKNDEE